MVALRAFGFPRRWPFCVALFFSFMFAARVSAQPRISDRWWARDKAMHCSVSLMLAADAHTVASAFTERPLYRALWGSALPMSLGLAKELHDQSIGRPFSWRDLTWDALGTATGTTVAWLIDRYFLEENQRSPRRTP